MMILYIFDNSLAFLSFAQAKHYFFNQMYVHCSLACELLSYENFPVYIHLCSWWASKEHAIAEMMFDHYTVMEKLLFYIIDYNFINFTHISLLIRFLLLWMMIIESNKTFESIFIQTFWKHLIYQSRWI